MYTIFILLSAILFFCRYHNLNMNEGISAPSQICAHIYNACLYCLLQRSNLIKIRSHACVWPDHRLRFTFCQQLLGKIETKAKKSFLGEKWWRRRWQQSYCWWPFAVHLCFIVENNKFFLLLNNQQELMTASKPLTRTECAAIILLKWRISFFFCIIDKNY